MNVLVTGATGFIGSHVARDFLRRGHEVHVTVRPSSDRRRIRDIESKLRIWEGEMDAVPVDADVVVHLAWYAVPGKYLSAPENRDCLEASRRLLAKVKGRAVFAGTCFEFDLTDQPLAENSPTKPLTLYAECKDALRREVERRPDSAWVRFFYQYGPGEDPRRLVPAVITQQLRGKPSKVTPGLQRADYLYVEDVAAAVRSVAESRLEGPVNIGSGQAPSVREIVTKIAELGGRPDLIEWGAFPQREGEPMLVQADNSRLRSTGWTPRVDLDQGLRQTFDWWRRELR
ncbi:MAG TPA: NAD(P)-dependent oxidoreductase [Planctomycetota bacterium]|nr:NAD(P)-dependent oxidoreductase [Planctomycetota bacterium]